MSQERLFAYKNPLKKRFDRDSRSLLTHLTDQLLANEQILRFVYRCIQEDLETLKAFYERGPHRNRRLKRHHRLTTHQEIAQDRLDDLIVVYRSQTARKRESGAEEPARD